MSSTLAPLDDAALDQLFREARTANAFTDDEVSDETVRTIYNLARMAPTSFNSQPMRVVLVRTAEARDRLLPHMIEPNRAKTKAAPLVAILGADSDFHENLPTLFPLFPQLKDMFFTDPEVRREESTFNTALQVAYFIMAVRAVGLAAGPQGGFDEEGVTKEFFADTNVRALVVLNIGKPDYSNTLARFPRLDYDRVVTTV